MSAMVIAWIRALASSYSIGNRKLCLASLASFVGFNHRLIRMVHSDEKRGERWYHCA